MGVIRVVAGCLLAIAAFSSSAGAQRTAEQRADSVRADSVRRVAHALYLAGDNDAATKKYAEAMRLDPLHPDPTAVLGWIAMKRGDYRRAAEWFLRSRALDDNAGINVSLGQAYGNLASRSTIRKLSYARRTRDAYERALTFDSVNTHALATLVQWYLIVPRAFGGSAATAEQYARRLVAVQPFAGRRALAQVAEQRGQRGVALKEYSATVRDFPDTVDAYLALAGYHDRAREPMLAIATLDRCVTRLPAEPLCAYELGKAMARQGVDLPRAEALLLRYRESLAPDARAKHAAALYYLSVVYERQGDAAKARAAMDRAKALDPEGVKARDAAGKRSR